MLERFRELHAYSIEAIRPDVWPSCLGIHESPDNEDADSILDIGPLVHAMYYLIGVVIYEGLGCDMDDGYEDEYNSSDLWTVLQVNS
jgi:hypothetical protein